MANILIVDSGSTSADWAQVDDVHIPKQVRTPGINPYFHTEKEIVDILQMEVVPFINHELVTEIFFYGAGLMSTNNLAIVEGALYQVFNRISMSVDTDILGAARSLYGNERGIACILGTGSNSCVYDGNKISHNIRSVGYILGDEGSGAHMGITLLKYYVRNELPNEIKDSFENTFRFRIDEILTKIYREGRASRFIASFAEFIQAHQEHPFIKELIYQSFEQFFTNNVCKYAEHRDMPVSFTGSIAYYFQNVLKEVASHKGLQLMHITEAPIEGLVNYHFKPKQQ